MGQKRSKLALLFSFITFQTINAAAQISGGGAPVGSDQFAQLIVGILNAITPLVEITSISTGMWFLAVTAGFYFPAKFFTSKIFGMVEESLDMGSRHRSGEEVPLGAKGFALAVAFVSANSVAIVVGASSLIIFGVIGLVIILLGFLGIFNSMGQSGYFGGILGGNGGAEADGGRRRDGGPQAETPPVTGGPDGPDPETQEALNEISDAVNNQGEAIAELRDDLDELDKEIDEVDAEDEDLKQKIQNLRSDVGDLQEFEERVQEMFDNGELSEEQFNVIEQMIEDAIDLEHLEETIEDHEDRLQDAESQLESQAEKLEEHEERISNIEDTMVEEIGRIWNELSEINSEKAQIREEMNQLERQLAQGAIERSKFKQEMDRLRSQINTQQEQVRAVLSQIQDLKQQDEELNSEIEALFEVMEGEIPDEFESLKRRIDQLEGEVDKAQRGERKEEEEMNQFGFPEGWESDMMQNIISEEKLVIEEEGDELSKEEKIAQGMEWLFGEEEEVAGQEEEVEGELEQLMMFLYQYAQQLEQDIVKEKEGADMLEKEEAKDLQWEEEGIRKIFAALSNMARGKTNMSAQQMERAAEQALERLEQLEQNTNDQQELEMISRAKDYARQLIGEEEKEQAEAQQGGEQASQLALEAQQFAGELPSGPEGGVNPQQVMQQTERSFRTAAQFLNPDNQKSVDQARNWIWNQEELIEQIEAAKQAMNDQNNIQEAERLESNLLKFIDKICEVRGIDKSQFGFLPNQSY